MVPVAIGNCLSCIVAVCSDSRQHCLELVMHCTYTSLPLPPHTVHNHWIGGIVFAIFTSSLCCECRNSPVLIFHTVSRLHQLVESGRQPKVKVPGLLRQFAAEWMSDHPVMRTHSQNVKVDFEERLKMEVKSGTKGTHCDSQVCNVLL